jgi:hypothetical protein
MTRTADRRPDAAPERARIPKRPSRVPHAPDGIPVRAERFLGLLDRSRREQRPA